MNATVPERGDCQCLGLDFLTFCSPKKSGSIKPMALFAKIQSSFDNMQQRSGLLSCKWIGLAWWVYTQLNGWCSCE